jgi:dTDP-4-amino-4,6-dideoxygalactose transaminase
VDPLTGNIDPRSVETLLKADPEIEAVVVVDWAGRQVDTKWLREVVEPKHIPVIEDAAHVFSRHHDTYPPDWYVAYSYQAIKHLTTVDGGSLVTPPEQRDRAELLRWFGLDRKKNESCRSAQDIAEAGYKYHMNDVNATVGIENIPYGIKSVQDARDNAEFYRVVFADLKHVVPPPPDPTSSWWLYVLKTPKRDEFVEFMKTAGIMVNPAHRRNDIHSAFPKSPTPLPGVDDYDSQHCAIPVGWWLSDNDRDLTARKVMEWDRTL